MYSLWNKLTHYFNHHDLKGVVFYRTTETTSSFSKKVFGGHQSFCGVTGIPGLVKRAVGFKARMDPLKKQFQVTYKGQVWFTQISACNEPTNSVTMYWIDRYKWKRLQSNKVTYFFDLSTPSSQAPVKSNKIIRFRFSILLSVYEPLVNTKKYQMGIRVIVSYDKECRSHAKIPNFST